MLHFLKTTTKRLLALASGLALTMLCAYLTYQYFISEKLHGAGKIILTPLIVGLLLGVGLFWYGITGKNGSENDDTARAGAPPQPGDTD